MTATITEEVVETRTTDDPGTATHIVRVPFPLNETMTPQAYVLMARVEGIEIEALCGHRWVPQGDPKARPICERCLVIYQHDPKGHGDRGDLPDA